MPVHEKARVSRGNPLKEQPCPRLPPAKALELPHAPREQRLIDVAKYGLQHRGRITPMIVDPPPEERNDQLGNVVQRELRLSADMQISDFFPHGFQR
jgi:hypothetical protein